MKKYGDEFKRQAVRKIFDGQSVASVARELGVSENQLHLWKEQRFEASTEAEKDLIKLRRENRRSKIEKFGRLWKYGET